MKVTNIPLIDLSIHPSIRDHHRMTEDDPAYTGLVESVADIGVRQPLIVDGSNRIVDGRHRFWSSKDAGLEKVPCLVEKDQEKIEAIILDTLLTRRHYSKGALAYLALPMIEDAVEAGKAVKDGNLKKGTSRKHGDRVIGKISSRKRLADRIGVHPNALSLARKVEAEFTENEVEIEKWQSAYRKLLSDAYPAEDEDWNQWVSVFNESILSPTSELLEAHPQLWKHRVDFANDPPPENFRAIYEPQLYNGKIGLERIVQAIGGAKSTKNKIRSDKDTDDWLRYQRYAKLKVRSFVEPFEQWEDMPEGLKEEVRELVAEKVGQWPSDVRDLLGRELLK